MTCAAHPDRTDFLSASTGGADRAIAVHGFAILLAFAAALCAALTMRQPIPAADPPVQVHKIIALVRADDPIAPEIGMRRGVVSERTLQAADARLERATGL